MTGLLRKAGLRPSRLELEIVSPSSFMLFAHAMQFAQQHCAEIL